MREPFVLLGWRVRDSNPRMLSSLIYSQIPLAAWVTRRGAPTTSYLLTEGARQEYSSNGPKRNQGGPTSAALRAAWVLRVGAVEVSPP